MSVLIKFEIDCPNCGNKITHNRLDTTIDACNESVSIDLTFIPEFECEECGCQVFYEQYTYSEEEE